MSVSWKGKGKAAPKTGGKSESGAPSFLKRGVDAQKQWEEEEVQKEQRKAERDKLWRFYMVPESEAKITFLDGALVTDGPTAGTLDVASLKEHKVAVMGKKAPSYYACVEEHETCPLCESDNHNSTVALFTIIDHRVSESNRSDKVYRDQKRIFAAKAQTVKKLTKKAQKTGGLIGCTFEVTRSDSKSATVGDDFELLQQTELSEIAKALDPDGKKELLAETDWEHELNILPAAELRKLFNLNEPSGPGYSDDSGYTPGGVTETEEETEQSPAAKDDLPF